MADACERDSVLLLQKKTSKQLLYAEKYAGTVLEQKLQIVDKKKARFGKPCMPPSSPVLSRVKEFLPKLAEANKKLNSLPQEEIDIENISPEYHGPVIEMNLALVPDLDVSDSDSCSSSKEESDEEESDEESEKEDDSNDGPAISSLLNLSNRKRGTKRKLVEVLDQEEEDH